MDKPSLRVLLTTLAILAFAAVMFALDFQKGWF
jgi:hypothetical protein